MELGVITTLLITMGNEIWRSDCFASSLKHSSCDDWVEMDKERCTQPQLASSMPREHRDGKQGLHLFNYT